MRTLTSRLTIANLLCAALLIIYAACFWNNLSGRWFDPHVTTDDGFQQVYPFYAVFHPGIFDNDLITKMMRCYLTPLHYAICYGVTWLCGDPIMMAHWVMLIQLLLTALFIFLAVDSAAGAAAPAFIAIAWFLHTRTAVSRLTGGLPRGWMAPLLAAFINFLLRGQHLAILVTLLVGSLLNPMATLLMLATYGMYLLYGLCRRDTRKQYIGHTLRFVAVSVLVLAVTLYITQVPPEIGHMFTYAEASKMPEYHAGGRFPFIPLAPVKYELALFGFHPFISWDYSPALYWRRAARPIVLALVLSLILFGLRRKKRIFDGVFLFSVLGIFVVYAAARVFAFKLYLPDRYLQLPLSIVIIIAITAGVWRAFYRAELNSKDLRSAAPSLLALIVLGSFVWCTSGSGLRGDANFDRFSGMDHGVFEWIGEHTPEKALFAGRPSFVNPITLFSMRRVYVSTETAHPFYDRYYEEMKRRYVVALQANYAHNLKELADICNREGIDYFVFERDNFYPEALANTWYSAPFEEEFKKLTAGRSTDDYAYRELPATVDVKQFPFMPFKNADAAIVDIHALSAYLSTTAASRG